MSYLALYSQHFSGQKLKNMKSYASGPVIKPLYTADFYLWIKENTILHTQNCDTTESSKVQTHFRKRGLSHFTHTSHSSSPKKSYLDVCLRSTNGHSAQHPTQKGYINTRTGLHGPLTSVYQGKSFHTVNIHVTETFTRRQAVWHCGQV